MFYEKNCHLIFNKREIWTTVIWTLFIAIVVWVFNNLGLIIYSLCGSRVPLNIPHFKNFAATINFYTHPINVPGIFPCHIHISDLCHFLGQANSKTSSFLKLGSQTNRVLHTHHSQNIRYEIQDGGTKWPPNCKYWIIPYIIYYLLYYCRS